MRVLIVILLSFLIAGIANGALAGTGGGSGGGTLQPGGLLDSFSSNTTLSCPTAEQYEADPNTVAPNLYGTPEMCVADPPDDPLGAIKCMIPNIVANYESLVGNVFSQMYCRMQHAMLQPLAAVMTLFVIGFGVMFLIGLVELSAKEAIVRLLKLALVWAFATNAEYGMGIAYNFLINAPKEGMTLMLSSITPEADDPSTPIDESSQKAGDLLQKPLQIVLPLPVALQCKAYEIDGKEPSPAIKEQCDKWGMSGNTRRSTITSQTRGSTEILKVLLLLTLFMIFLPPVFTMVMGFLIQVIVTFVRTFVAYLLAIAGIALLLTLSPIFLSFALFKTTYEYFSSWIRYLSSFAIQIIIIFGFLALIRLLNPADFFANLIATSYPYEVKFGFESPQKVPMLPDIDIPVEAVGTLWSVCNDYKLSTSGKIECPTTVTIPNPYPGTGSATGPWVFNPCGNYAMTGNEIRALKDGFTYENRTYLGCEGVAVFQREKFKMMDGDDDFDDEEKKALLTNLDTRPDNVLPVDKLIVDPLFIRFVVSSVLAFFVLLYIMEAALRNVPELAARLAGTGPALGYMTPINPESALHSGGAGASLMKDRAALTNFGLKPAYNAFKSEWKARK